MGKTLSFYLRCTIIVAILSIFSFNAIGGNLSNTNNSGFWREIESAIKKVQSNSISDKGYIYDWATTPEVEKPDAEMVKAGTAMSVSASPNPICSGSSTTVTFTFNCGDGWPGTAEYSYDNVTWFYLSRYTDALSHTASFSFAPASTTTVYGRVRSSHASGGGLTYSGSTVITVNPTPGITTVSGAGTFCSSALLTATGPCGGSRDYGSGTSTTNLQPLYSFYNYSRSCQLILRNEIACDPGVITHLAVYVGTAGTHAFTGITIRLKKTTATTAPTTFPGDGTQVWSGSYTFSSTGWVTFDITDFNWNSDNLLIEWQHGYTAYTSNYPYFNYTTTATNLATYAFSDGALPTTGTNTTARPNYRLTFATAPTVYWQNTTSNGTSTATPSTSQSVTATGTYYFRARTAAGCWGTQGSAAVTIHTPPTAPTGISGTATICNGNSTTLTATGGVAGSGCTYQWYAGGCGSGSVLGTGASLTVSPTTTTTYYVRRVGTTSCTNTTSCASVTVTVFSVSTAPSSINAIIN